MSLHDDDKYYSPLTLEPRREDDYSPLADNMITDVDQPEPLKNYLSTRQLPALDSLQNNYQNDDYIRIKLSGMSVGVSPNSSPRGHPQYQHEQRGSEYFPPVEEERSRLVYDPIRSSVVSQNTPLIRRIMHHQDPLSQRRHSIANMDLNRRSSSASSYNSNSNIHHETNTNTSSSSTLYQQQQQQQYHFQPPFPGHYSAPSSPPLHHSQIKSNTTTNNNINKHQTLPSFSPYNNGRIKSSIHHSSNIMEDDSSPPPPLQQMRRNSSALLYRNHSNSGSREQLASRRMSSSSSSTSSLNHPRINQIGKIFDKHVKEEEEDDIIINKQQRDEMEGLYSRSPELRISHKLAERKRRKEMKDLFEELKDALPVDKSMKTSKWEILSKAVEYIGLLRHRDYSMEQELVLLKHELENLKNEKSSSSASSSVHENKSYHQHYHL